MLAEVIHRDVAAGRPYAHDYRIVRSDGEVRWVLDKGQAAYGPKARCSGSTGCLLDVTGETEEAFEQQDRLLWLLQRVAVAANEARETDQSAAGLPRRGLRLHGLAPRPRHHARRGRGRAGLDGSDSSRSTRPTRWRASVRRARPRFVPGYGCRGPCCRPDDLDEDVPPTHLSPAARHHRGSGLRAALAFPVLVGTEVVAVLEFYGEEPPAGRQPPARDGRRRHRARPRGRANQVRARPRRQNEQLRQLDALKDEFVSLVSHELRTPLTSIRGYLELFVGGAGEPDRGAARSSSRSSQRNAERLLRLVGDLLFVAQVDAGRLSVERDGARPRCARGASRSRPRRPAAAAKGSSSMLEAEPATHRRRPRPARPAARQPRLERASSSLPEGGRRASASPDGRRDACSRSPDTGMGIPADEQAQLFERFFRSSNARGAAVPGTGLGLVIVRAIADAHGGTFGLDEHRGRRHDVHGPPRRSGRARRRGARELQEVASLAPRRPDRRRRRRRRGHPHARLDHAPARRLRRPLRARRRGGGHARAPRRGRRSSSST